jgi:hypothetical protein
MRLLFICLVIACAGLAASLAAAQKSYSKRGYSSCLCDYGYPGFACVPVVSCLDEGGRCRERCRRQHE